MTPKLLALAKVCSVLVNIRDVSWHLSKRGSELESCTKVTIFHFGQKWRAQKTSLSLLSLFVWLEALVVRHDPPEERLALGDGAHGRHEPGVQGGLDVEPLIFGADQDGVLGPQVLVRPEPLDVVLHPLGPRPEEVVVHGELGVLEQDVLLQTLVANLVKILLVQKLNLQAKLTT